MSNFEKFKFVINSIYNSKVFLNKDGTLEELEKIFFKCQHLEAICMDDKINYTVNILINFWNCFLNQLHSKFIFIIYLGILLLNL